jgi:hypothetical protein
VETLIGADRKELIDEIGRKEGRRKRGRGERREKHFVGANSIYL